MGIKYLNKFIREQCDECNESIQCVHLKELSGKTIAIDISIYLYKYTFLIENIYSMISIFKYYGIIPIFIFDGKPPVEKKVLLMKRKQNKIHAQEEYNCLKEQLLNEKNKMNEHDKQEIISYIENTIYLY